MKLHRYISGVCIAAIATASLATKIEVSQINGFNEAVQQQITLYGVPVTRSINSGAGLTGGGDLSADRTLAIDYTHTGTWSGPQTFSGGLSGALTGNASTASHLATSRTFSYTGDATGGPTSFDGSANVSTALALANTGTAGTYGDATHVPQFTTDAKGRVTGVTAVAINGIPASSAVKLATARNFSITGDVATSSACSFDGTADCTLNVAMAGTVAGAHTFSGALTASGGVIGNLTGNVTGDVSGNSGTATALANPQTIGTLTGDATATGSAFNGTAANTNALTLATVNSNVGSFGDATDVATFTVNAKGLITAAGSTPISFPSLAGYATLAGTQTFTGTDTFSNAIVGSVTGNAATATALTASQTIGTLTGDVTSTGSSFNGTAANTNATTLATTQSAAHTWSGAQTFNSTVSLSASSPSLGITSTSAGSTFFLDTINTTVDQIFLRNATLNMWSISKSGTSNSGSNVGSDFRVARYDDTGTVIDIPLVITRSTGLITLLDGMNITGGLTLPTGNIVATAGNITATAGNVSSVGLTTTGTASFGSGGTLTANGPVALNGNVTIGNSTSFTAGNTSSNFVIGGVTSTARSVTYNNFGQPTYRYDDNSAAATLGKLTNYAISAINQGASIGPITYGTGGVADPVVAAQIAFYTTDTYAALANRSDKMQMNFEYQGVAVTNAFGVDPANGEYVMNRLVHGTADFPVGTQNMSATTSQTPTINSLSAVMLFTGTLTANVTYTLPACVSGEHLRITRTGTGAFTWTIAPTTKTLGVNTWADFECSGTAFIETASGSL